MKNTVLVTGAAGFIGFHISKRLLQENYTVIGFDNLNNYYDVELKKDRIKNLRNHIIHPYQDTNHLQIFLSYTS